MNNNEISQLVIPKISWADRFIGIINPRHLILREQQKLVSYYVDEHLKRAAYKSAETDRFNLQWSATSNDVNAILTTDLKKIRNRSRYLFRNNPEAVSLMNANIAYVIGTGFTPQALVRKRVKVTEDGKEVVKTIELESWNEFTEELFVEWGEDCDISGSPMSPVGFIEDCELFLRKLIEDGEVFVHAVVDRKSGQTVPLKTEFIEPETLDESKTSNGKNPVKLGVELDARTGQPVAYWIRKYSVRGNHSDSTRILAENMIHAFKRYRPYQVRGIPALAAVIPKFYQLDEFIDAELIAEKIGACFSVFLEQPAGSSATGLLKTPENQTATDIDGNKLGHIQPGIIANVPAGFKASMMQPQRPSSTFDMFTRRIDRLIGSGAQMGAVGYEALTRDVSRVSYASGTLSRQMDYQTFRGLQQLVMRKFCSPIWRTWMSIAVLNKVLIAPGYYEAAPGKRYWQRHSWNPSGWPRGINPAQEVNASRESMRAGITTLADECAEYGRDWKNQLRLTARIQKEAEKLGVVLSSDAAVSVYNGMEDMPEAVPDQIEKEEEQS